MGKESTPAYRNEFFVRNAQLVDALHASANGARWGLSREVFAGVLQRSAEKRFGGARGDSTELESYLKQLHLEDLALACACSEGIEAAWEFFIAHFRRELRDASRAILRSSGSGNEFRAEELADSLYAELYGVRVASGARRKSLFEYFHGRSKLSTWLRAILAQRHVDLLRADRGDVSLDAEEVEPQVQLTLNAGAILPDPDRAKYVALLDRALGIALSSLAPRERMLLACYYVDDLTLAEIGRMFHEHESTISRQLERTRRALKEAVTSLLHQGTPALDGHGATPGLDDSQVELALECAVGDWGFDLSHALTKAETAAESTEK